jgi:hypothetical protein
MVVVAILSILTLISVPNFHDAQIRAQVSAVKNNMRVLATDIELLNVDTNHYPLTARWRWLMLSKDPVWQPNGNLVSDRFSNAYDRVYGRFDDLFEFQVMRKFRKLDDNWVGYKNGRYLFHGFGYFSMPMMLDALREGCSWQNVQVPKLEEVNRLAGPWMLVSCGPDLFELGPAWLESEDGYAETSYQANCSNKQFVEYDPTNGTVSFGNMYRTQKNPAGLGLSQTLADMEKG